MTFDPATYGLMSHYPPKVQQRIRRTILEDWQASRVKLPTYMKLIARYISSTGVPEDWLSKLSHQTMSKMLSFESTPRHKFWACLHLYIDKKYGSGIVADIGQSPIGLLGQAISSFGTVTPIAQRGEFRLNETTLVTIETLEGQDYAKVSKVIATPSPNDEDTEIQHKFEGVGFLANGATNESVIILRDCLTHEVAVTLMTATEFKAVKS